MIKGHLNNYEINGVKASNEEAIDYAKKHPETYQVYELKGELIIRTAKGGFDLEKIKKDNDDNEVNYNDDLTKNEIMKELDSKGIGYKKSQNKKELSALLITNNKAQKEENSNENLKEKKESKEISKEKETKNNIVNEQEDTEKGIDTIEKEIIKDKKRSKGLYMALAFASVLLLVFLGLLIWQLIVAIG